MLNKTRLFLCKAALLLFSILGNSQEYQDITESEFYRIANVFYSKQDSLVLNGYFRFLKYEPHQRPSRYKTSGYTECYLNENGKVYGSVWKCGPESGAYFYYTFSDGLKDGVSMGYNEDGTLSWKSTYASDTTTGRSFNVGKSFTNHRNGKPHYRSEYDKSGNLKERKIYDDKGTLRIHEVHVYKGNSVYEDKTQYNLHGKLESQSIRKDDELLESTFYKKGVIVLTNRIDTISGKLFRKEFYPDGELKSEQVSSKILPHSITKKFDRNGKLIFKEEKFRKKIIGHTFSYDDKGNLEYEKFFNSKGTPIKVHTLEGGKRIIQYDKNGNVIKEKK